LSDSVHKGGCACGKVRVEARGEPYRVGVCHCLTCRKLHGAPFSFYAVFSPVLRAREDIHLSGDHHRELGARAKIRLPGVRLTGLVALFAR